MVLFADDLDNSARENVIQLRKNPPKAVAPKKKFDHIEVDVVELADYPLFGNFINQSSSKIILLGLKVRDLWTSIV